MRDRVGFARLGLMSNQTWHDDPKRLAFVLSRYKFIAKMLEGSDRVLEIGCADGFASRIVEQAVSSLTAVDFDPVFIEDARERHDGSPSIDYRVHDMLSGPLNERYEAAYALDVLEHIQRQDEDRFLQNVVGSLTSPGVLIVGMPSLESQKHASAQSKAGHVNCKTSPDLKETMRRHFETVFMFSMNDEVVHTGFAPMAHYLLAIGTSVRVQSAES